MKKYLIDLYRSTTDAIIIRKQIHECKQRIDNHESINAFSTRFRLITEKIHGFTEKEKVSTFLNAIDVRLEIQSYQIVNIIKTTP